MSDAPSIKNVTVQRIDARGAATREDAVVVEEPLEIRIGPTPISVTMRTPGHDAELAAGFLLTENIVHGPADIDEIAHCAEPGKAHRENVIIAALSSGAPFDVERLRRHFYATSSCGLCGKASIDQVRQNFRPIEAKVTVPLSLATALPQRMRDAQSVFESTGGLHAAALFNERGELLCLREDVGRHNAVDKVVGWAVLNGRLPLSRTLMQVSGRAGFEIVQKAAVAGIGYVGAVSAASTLAIDMAREAGMTLVGFVRDGACVVYAGAERVVDDSANAT